jgi:hypothetical protein
VVAGVSRLRRSDSGSSSPKLRSTVVLVHGAWADGSSWSDIIGPLLSKGPNVLAAPIPLASVDFQNPIKINPVDGSSLPENFVLYEAERP